MEVTSLSQADAINEIGIYKIGNWTKRNMNENMVNTILFSKLQTCVDYNYMTYIYIHSFKNYVVYLKHHL